MPKAVKVYFNPKPILEAKNKAVERVLVRQATYVRQAMKRSIRPGTGKAPIGKQPLTHNLLLRNSIQWGLDRVRESAVIGPSFRIAGIIGHTHEFGGIERDNKIRKGTFFQRLLKTKTKRWNLVIGGYGPIREEGSKLKFARLSSAPQVAKARQLATKVETREAVSRRSKGARYPKRPFAGRVLDRKRVQKRLADFWKDTIGPSGATGAAGRVGP